MKFLNKYTVISVIISVWIKITRLCRTFHYNIFSVYAIENDVPRDVPSARGGTRGQEIAKGFFGGHLSVSISAVAEERLTRHNVKELCICEVK